MTRIKNKGQLYYDKGIGMQINEWKKEIDDHRKRIKQLEKMIDYVVCKRVAS